jgi:HPt (histidine-containing phosphotransfer) domain-containing protein
MDDAKSGPGRTTELQRQMDQIGDRFVQRLLTELTIMRETLADVSAGELSGLKDLELTAHKIHGSSAMFGFASLSELAGTLERLVVAERLANTGNLVAIEGQFALLDIEGRAMAARRGSA